MYSVIKWTYKSVSLRTLMLLSLLKYIRKIVFVLYTDRSDKYNKRLYTSIIVLIHSYNALLFILDIKKSCN